MCTAAAYKAKEFYFGRTLDYEASYGEEITVTTRNFVFDFRYMGECKNHYAIIGMAHVADNYPLYYDAMNEKGLCIAGLNFVGNAFFGDFEEEKENVAQYEVIPWILSQCADLNEAKEKLSKINITSAQFNEFYPSAQLHWLIGDKTGSVVVEAMSDGLHIYDNPVGVLTNNPPFEQQVFQLNNYMHLSPKQPKNTFGGDIRLKAYSRGMGALGMPGDLSSVSRFVRTAFTKANSKCGDTEEEMVSQFFHILGSAEQQRGCCEVREGEYEFTIYTSCCSASKGIYYYTTYDNHQISAVDMNKTDLNGDCLYRFPVIKNENINYQN